MKRDNKNILSVILLISLLVYALPFTAVGASASSGSGIIDASGWLESAYAEWAPVSGADGYNAYVAGSDSSVWTKIDSALIRDYSSYYRVDALGLKAGSYQIKIIPTSGGAELSDKALTTETLVVSPYDRSGYAHFNYTDGVGAYNDDGTLKEGAIILYVTEDNKNTVSVTSKDGTTVTGIGNILNSVGQDVGGGKTSKGGIANSNSDIIRKLANDGTPLVVRIIGNVTAPDGLTAFNSVNYGGSTGDNGYMARMSGGKNITIEGVGFDAAINGWGLHFICQTADYKNGIGKSFEVRNIAFRNVPEDCVGMEGQQEGSTLTAPVERCWIHHCSFYAPKIANPAESDKDGGDGACDFKRGQYFTNAYCLYEGYHKTNLIGSGDDSLQYHITYHHNYWRNCESRGPLARQANIHMYNNIFEGQTSYCMSIRANAYIFSEYNMFFNSKKVSENRNGGVCKSYNNSFVSCSGADASDIIYVADRDATVSSSCKYANFDTNSALSYIPSGDYVLQESISEMKAVVMAEAGTQKENIVTPDEVNTSVIPAALYPTAAVVLDYSKNLNKSYISSAGTYDNIVFSVSKFLGDYISLGGNSTPCNIVFYADTSVNVTVTQYSDSANDVILCSAVGECIMVGGGTAENLPSGYYFIQSNSYDVGEGKYKEAKISGLTITAVDPNASTNPIPTPPSVTDPDNGGNAGGGSTILPAGAYMHSFTENGLTDPSGFFSFFDANLSDSKGTVEYNGLTLDVCLKIESKTNISLTAPERGTLLLVFGGSTNASGKQIKIDGTSTDIDSTQILSVSVEAGVHTVTKDDSIFLYYIAYFSESQEEHTHDYFEEEIVAATCTEAGLHTFVCACGDSYTEEIAAKGHDFEDGFCVDCGINDPDGGENGEDDPISPDEGETEIEAPDEPEEELNFFERIWKAIVDFFKKLFGIKD
nr:hypothetical protein [Oscillospiraceae bacterium]